MRRPTLPLRTSFRDAIMASAEPQWACRQPCQQPTFDGRGGATVDDRIPQGFLVTVFSWARTAAYPAKCGMVQTAFEEGARTGCFSASFATRTAPNGPSG